MHVWRMVLREISHRKLNFAMALLSVTVAVACLVGAMSLLKADELRTQQAGAELNDAMRKITVKLGFNILILPEDEDLQAFHTTGEVTSTMPESYVDKLANTPDLVIVNHLLPMVSRRINWPERDVEIILVGTRGEVPIAERAAKKPLLDNVDQGSMVVGYQLHQKLGLAKGDQVTLMGREFTISQLYSERGTSDDSTVWINLGQAQKMLGMQNLLNAILALECNCASQDRVTEIRTVIARILPGTQVLERGDKALARAEARNKAKAEAEASLQRHEEFASVLVPVVLLGSAVWIGLLSFGNVRQRTAEIGILRAIGFRSSQILSIFLGKHVLVGLAGAVVGYAIGVVAGRAFSHLPSETAAALPWLSPELLLASIVAAPVLTVIAGWIPALLAAQQDPAVVLSEE